MVESFKAAAEAVGGVVKHFVGISEAMDYLGEVSGGRPVSRSFLPPEIADALPSFSPASSPAEAHLCISWARAGIANTGTLLLDFRDPAGRAASGLATVHAVFLREETIVPDLHGVHDILKEALSVPGGGYLSLTTGPSRTADIERVLTIGVHGPKELHILVLKGGEA